VNVQHHPITGERDRKFFKTRPEAQAFVSEMEKLGAANLHPDGDPMMPLRDYGAHIKTLKQQTKKTAGQWAWAEEHVFPLPVMVNGKRMLLGDVPLLSVEKAHIKQLIQVKRLQEEYAPNSVRLMYALVRHVLNCACGDELIAVNPADKLPPHIRALMKTTYSEHDKPMTAAEYDLFLATAEREGPAWQPLFLTLGSTGMRLGEALGWQLDDIDVDKREAKIVRSLGQECSTRNPEPGPTKNRKGRVVDLSTRLTGVLREIIKARPALAMEQGWRPVPPWMFITTNGTPNSQSNAFRAFKRILTKAKLPSHFSPHSLRHTFACLTLINAKDRNVIQYVQQQLGHASIGITVDIYGKWIRITDPEAADRLDALVNGASQGSGRAADGV
jgi:integrase